MQLRGVDLRNIRSFETAHLELTPGTTLLVGDVGAGKSSLLYAIEMALFGVAEVEASYLVRHGRSEAEVAVHFGDESGTYEIARRFRRVRRSGRETFVPDTITFSKNGEPTSYSATELRQRVIELVGFPDNPNPKAHSDLWRWAIYVPQERMREILAADPEERLETVRKALGVERFRIAAENAGNLASDLKKDARGLREEAGRLAYWDEELTKALRDGEELRVERVRLESEVATQARALEAARNALAKLERAGTTFEADQREHEGLLREEAEDRRAREAAEVRRRELAAELGRSRAEVAAGEASIAVRPQLLERLAALDADRDRLQATMSSHESDLRDLAGERAALKAAAAAREELARRADRAERERVAALQALESAAKEGPTHEPPAPTVRSLPDLDAATSTARSAEQSALERLVSARADLGAVDELLREGVCPTCHQTVQGSQFEEHRAEAVALKDRCEQVHRAATASREEIEGERKSRERWERARERWVETERRRASLRQALASWEKELGAAQAALASATPTPERAVDTEVRWERAERALGELRLRWEDLGRERTKLAAELERLARAEERQKGLRLAIQRFEEELRRLGQEADLFAQRSAGRTDRLAVLAEQLRGRPALLASLAAQRQEAERIETLAGKAREALARSEARRESLSERVALAERGRADRQARIAEATELDAKAVWVAEPFRYQLLAMEKDLLAHAQASFDRSFSRYFAALIDDPGLIARTDAAFTPEVTINGEVTPAEALSGGERTSLALAFRLALASTVRSLGEVRLQTLLLDEPTDGFSSEQVVRMGELLEELALPQVIVVSHEAQLAGIADRTVRIVKRDGRSTIEVPGAPEPERHDDRRETESETPPAS